jgi:hypothetical protein
MRRPLALVLIALVATAAAQIPRQPKVQPGPQEPDWIAILDALYGLRMFDDLANPVTTTAEATPGLFKKAGPGPVSYRPVIALGLPVTIRGGWYPAAGGSGEPDKKGLWSYQFKNTARDIETGSNLPPPLAGSSATEFDPGDRPFGLWVGNDQFKDFVFSQPRLVAAHNPRLAKQPYKAMIYPYKDKATGKVVPHSFLIGWEYSTNDDFQDVVCRIDNVELVDDQGKGVGSK